MQSEKEFQITTRLRVVDEMNVVQSAIELGRIHGRDNDWVPECLEEAIEELEILKEGAPLDHGYEIISRTTIKVETTTHTTTPSPENTKANIYFKMPTDDGLYWYWANDAALPEPVLINRTKYSQSFKGFNGRLQSWLRDGEYLEGPQPLPVKQLRSA